MTDDRPADNRLGLVLTSALAYALPPDGLGDDHAIRAFVPDDPASFAVHLQIMAGPFGGAPDSFDVIVCTPAWVASHFDYFTPDTKLAGGRVLPGRRLWLVDGWDFDAIETAVQQLVDSATGSSWGPLANWLSRYAPWEFAGEFDRENGVEVDTPPA